MANKYLPAQDERKNLPFLTHQRLSPWAIIAPLLLGLGETELHGSRACGRETYPACVCQEVGSESERG